MASYSIVYKPYVEKDRRSFEMQATSTYSSSQFSTGKPGILWKC
jgi:hypothetical protein